MHIRQTLLALYAAFLIKVCSAYVPIGARKQLARAITDDVTFQAFCSGHVPFVCVENALSFDTIAGIRQDASCLQSAGLGATSGVTSKTAGIRQGVHQIWLQSPGAPPLQALVGNLDSRKELLSLTETIRQQLCMKDRVLPPEYVELSYLLYEKGAFYKRHVDTTVKRDERTSERCVSLILYLGDPSLDERPWDHVRDGGALRIYGNSAFSIEGRFEDEHDAGQFADICPMPGTLVLFDSAVVDHAVLTTHRCRSAIVGWFGAEIVA
jgi:hypothetical protein